MSRRTIEVVPVYSSPHGDRVTGWMATGSGYRKSFDKKSEAKSAAKKFAKREASRKNQSMEVKLFKRDGSYQDEHVYKP